MSDLDPRWEWAEVRRLCDEAPTYIKGRCNHLEVVPVESGGKTVAHLCLTCDAQLPAEWRGVSEPPCVDEDAFDCRIGLHDWMERGTEGDRWRECWPCGELQDVEPDDRRTPPGDPA